MINHQRETSAIGGLVLAALLITASVRPAIAGEAEGRPRIDTSRLISIGGATTEILYDLGVEDRIVAVDTTSLYPPAALKTRPNVGYLRALSAEGVLSLSPTAILASDKAGPAEVVRALKASRIDYIEIDEEPTEAALVARIRKIGEVFEREEEAEALAARVMRGFSHLARARALVVVPRSALIVLGVQGGRILVGGRETSADAMLKLAGIRNVAADFHGFKPMTGEAVLNANPDAIIAMSRSRGPSTVKDLNGLPAIAATSAGKASRVAEMDALLLLGFGPRTPEAASTLMKIVYADTVPGKAERQR